MNPAPGCPAPDDLTAYAADGLPAAARDRLAAHLQACAACRARLADARTDALALGDRSGPRAAAGGGTVSWPATVGLTAAGPETPTGSEQPTVPAGAPAVPTVAAAGGPPGRLRDYQLLDKIGQGGMGAVYRARHTRLDRVVALKVLPAAHLDDPAAVARFQREMKAVGKLDHENIVRATDAGEESGAHFLVMELVPGRSLAELVRARGRLPVADACELARQTAVGLAHAHAHGLVHRDVKPSNLLVTPQGRVKILDLGLALLQEGPAAGADRTVTGMVMGSFDYIAPEQTADAHAVDGRADQYSLGCTLYHLLAGHPPFHGRGFTTSLQKLQAHALSAVPPLRGLRPDVPEALAAVLDRLLAKDPARRYPDAAAAAAALAPFAAGADLPALVAAPDHPADPLAGTVTLPGGRRRPRRWPVVAAGLVLLAGLVAGVAVLLLQSREGSPERRAKDDHLPVRPAAPPRHLALVGADLAELRAWVKGLRQTGHQPVFINTYVEAGTPRTVALAVRPDKPVPWEVTLDLDQEADQKAFDDFLAQGYMVVSECGYPVGDAARFHCFFARDGSDRSSYLVEEVKGLRKKLAELADDKCRAVEVTTFRVGDERSFCVVTEPDQGNPGLVRIDLTAEQYQAFLDECSTRGLQPVSVSVLEEDGKPLFTVVAHPARPGVKWRERHGLTRAQLLKENERLAGQGYHPILMPGYVVKGQVYFLGFWVRDPPAEKPRP